MNPMTLPSATASSHASSSEVYISPAGFGNISSSSAHGRSLQNPTAPSGPFAGPGFDPRVDTYLNPSDDPRTQRRKLNTPPVPPLASTAIIPPIGSYAFQSQQPRLASDILPPNAIGHTGQATYVLSPEAELSSQDFVLRSAGGADGMTELADVVGQLSLNENKEVRYHGRFVILHRSS